MISNNSWSRSLHFPTAHPLSFFEGLKPLLTFVNKRSATMLRTVLNERFPIELPIETEGHLEFCYLEIAERFKLIAATLWLLDDWPHRFVSVLRESHFSRSRFAEEVNALPYWLIRALNEHLDQRVYIPSPEEIHSVKNHLERKNVTVNACSVAKALGIGEDWARSLRPYWGSR